jgi:hypothetical protein
MSVFKAHIHKHCGYGIFAERCNFNRKVSIFSNHEDDLERCKFFYCNCITQQKSQTHIACVYELGIKAYLKAL